MFFRRFRRRFLPALLFFLLATGLTVPAVNPARGSGSLGDWIVTGSEVVEHQTINLQGNLIIEDGGSLQLNDVDLTMDGSYAGQYRIEVKTGGELAVMTSRIAASNPDNPYAFSVRGASFELKNSELHNAGWGPQSENLDPAALQAGQLGLYIAMGGAVLEGNTISGNYIGVIDAGNGTRLANNTILDNTVHAIYVQDGSEGIIQGNQVTHSGNVSALLRMRPGAGYRIAGNDFQQNLHRGVLEVMGSNNNVIEANTIRGLGGGIQLMFNANDNLIRDNQIDMDETGIWVYGRRNRVIDNHISGTDYPLQTGIFLIYAYNSVVAGNTIENCGNHHGILARNSSYNAILNNTLSGRELAPDLESSFGLVLINKSRLNFIAGNRFTGFQHGLGVFYGSDDNDISGNQFDSAPHQAAVVDAASGNRIFSNNFLGSGPPPYDDGENRWDNGGLGNYWAAYTGSDADGDGIGDQPYPIGPAGVDPSPRMDPLPMTIPAAEPVLPPAPQEALDDLVGMRVQGTQVIENQTLHLNFIDVPAGAELTLRNVTVLTGGDPRGPSSLQVYGRLTIEDSTLTHMDYGSGFIMLAHPGSTLILRGSTLDGCGQEWWYGGLQVRSADFLLEDNHIRHTILRFNNVNGGQLSGNTVEYSYQALDFNNNHSLIQGNTFTHSLRPALAGTGSGNTFQDNTLSAIWDNGVHLFAGDHNRVEGNFVADIAPGYTGMRIKGDQLDLLDNTVRRAGTGIHVEYAGEGSAARVSGNRVSGAATGIEVRADNVTASENRIENCSLGVLLEGKNGRFSGNVFSENELGLQIGMGYNGNQLSDNGFFANTRQAEDNGWGNLWDDGARGNFWSDYSGPDVNEDGIGDLPYPVPPNGVDRFPLVLNLPPQNYLPLVVGRP